MQPMSSVLRRLSVSTDDTSHGPSSTALCKSCRGLKLTLQHLQAFQESPLPGGLFALDLQQGYIELPINRKDTSPGFPALGLSAARGCRFCRLLLVAIASRQSQGLSQGGESTPHTDVQIGFRYSCAAEPGSQSFNLGEWPVILESLEVTILGSGNPILLAFRLYCDDGLF